MFWLLSLGLVLASALSGAASASISCRSVGAGETIAGILKQRGNCILIPASNKGFSIQVSVSQPVDFKLTGQSPGAPAVAVDGFDFGEETLTLEGGVSWRVDVVPVERAPTSVAFGVTVRIIDAARTSAWRDAESFATKAKQTMSVTDVSSALAQWQALGNLLSTARMHIRFGSASLRSGNIAAARAAYDEAYRICTLNADLRCRAEAANNSGLAARRLGEIEQARTRFVEAASGWDELGHVEGAAITQSNLALLLSQTGEWQEAIAAYDRARRMLRTRNRVAYARVLNNLGLCYLSLGEHSKAQAYFLSALAIFPGSTADAVRARLNLGRSYMLIGKNDLARPQLERSVAGARKVKDPAALADALNNLGQLMLQLQNTAAAREQLEEALILYQQTRERRGQSSALHHLALVAVRENMLPQARESLTQALDIRTDLNMWNDAAESCLALAELELNGGDIEVARAYAERALTTIELVRSRVPGHALRASYYASVRRVFDVLLETVMRSAGAEASERGLLAAERGRAQALLDSLTDGGRDADVPESLTTRRARIQRKLNWMSLRLASAGPAEEVNLRQQIQLLLAEDQEVEALIRNSRSAGKVMRQPPTFAQLSSAVPRDSAILEFYLGPSRSFLWLVEQGRLSAFSLPAAKVIRRHAAEVARLFGSILERRRHPTMQRQFEAACNRLSRALFDSLAGVSLPGRIFLAPDGVLHSVPIAALKIPGSSRPIGLAHDLIRIPSASYLLSGKLPRATDQFSRTILSVVDPVFSAGDPRLSGSSTVAFRGLPRLAFSDDVRGLSNLMAPSRRRVLRGFEATPEKLRQARVEDYAVLHFSTHAIVDHEIPEMSRIALSLVDKDGHPVDGFLRPYELAQWRLDGSLVVLAACETAQGKQVLGEGVIGLANSLLHAGAAQLVVAVTRIDDEASAKFFDHLYREMLGTRPVSTSRAMTLARRAIAGSGRWSDPYYWAAFEMVGRPES